jgi:membrane-bound inhibitor of C-type lysozyme
MLRKLIIIIISVFLLFSCQSNKTTKPEQDAQMSVQRRIVSVTKSDIIYTQITNQQGELLEAIFDNAKNEALITFNGKKINLKGEETGSGIKYSNEQYLFTQWKDDIELKKDGKIVFKY